MSLRSYLTEANVLNVNAIDDFCKTYAAKTSLKQGKDWLVTKLRSHLINDTSNMHQIHSGKVPASMPDYIHRAVEAGQPVWAFDPLLAAHEFDSAINHIIDYFNAMAETVKTAPTNPVEQEDHVLTQKAITKLQKIPFSQITQAADQWFNRAGARARGMTKTGVDVIMQLTGGYYVVTFTDRATMMRDGSELQNCLGQGFYWDDVARGSMMVYAIRKPNDEAVVGLRATRQGQGWSLSECKGKNNQPVGSQYRATVIEFLEKMKFDNTSNCYDLTAADIYAFKGKFGTFKDIAENTFNDDLPSVGHVSIFATDAKIVMYCGANNLEITGKISNGVVATLSPSLHQEPMIALINALMSSTPVKLGKPVLDSLVTMGIFPGAHGYGRAADVGETIYDQKSSKGVHVQAVRLTNNGNGYLVFDRHTGKGTETIQTLAVSKMMFGSAYLPGILETMSAEDFFDILATAGIRGTQAFDSSTCYISGWYYSTAEKHYRHIKHTGERIGRNDGNIIYKAPNQPLWMYSHNGRRYMTFSGSKKLSVFINETQRFEAAPIVQFLVEKYPFQSMSEPELYGVAQTPEGLVASPKRFLEAIQAAGDDAAYDVLFFETLSDQRVFYEMGLHGLTQAITAKLYAAMRPKAPYFRSHKLEDEWKVGDLSIAQYEVSFPEAFFQLAKAKSYRFRDTLTPRLEAVIAKDGETVLAAFTKFMDDNPDILPVIPDRDFRAGPWIRQAEFAIDQRRRELSRRATDKHAELGNSNADVGISDRFRALNTLRKLGKR